MHWHTIRCEKNIQEMPWANSWIFIINLVNRCIFLRQYYLYQVQRVKTLRFTLRPFGLPVVENDYITLFLLMQEVFIICLSFWN